MVLVLVGSDVPVAIAMESMVVTPVAVGVAVACVEVDKKGANARKNSENIVGGDIAARRGALETLYHGE